MVHADATGPAVVGIFRPVVVLPATLASPESGVDLRHALLHELAHIRRRDPLRALVCQSIQILYWYHPLVWAARVRLSTLREIACDARVIRATGAREEYRHTLLRLARPLAAARPAGTLGLFGRGSELLERLSILERPLPRRSPFRGLAAVALVAACIVGTLAIDAATSIRVMVTDSEIDPGCLRRRLAVYARLAEEAAAAQERER
jgi:beta-lactamase regulating signal transducer with metallopeptidase domain